MRARSAARRLAGLHPAVLLATLALAQFGVVAWLAFGTAHNGWIWYSGGDATEYWTAEWSLAHGWIPQSVIGWGVPVFYAWIPILVGSTLAAALPLIVLLHVFVLLPLTLVLVWALADRLYERRYAWATSVLWVAAPFLFTRAFVPRYRPRIEEGVLAPHWAGLTNMADFPTMVTLLAAAWAATRAVQNGRFGSALGAGVLAGVSIGLKPSNGYFVLPVIVLLAVYRRPRAALGWGAGLAPALVTLTIWKLRGLGTIPILSAYAPVHLASGPVAGLAVRRYLPYDWHHLSLQWRQLGEFASNRRLLEFLIVASAIGALRRNWRVGLFLISWFVSYCVLKGMSPQADIQNTSYWRLTMPGLVAFVLLLPALGYLLPGVRARQWVPPRETWVVRARTPGAVLAVAVSLVPIVLMLAEQPAPRSPLRLVRWAAGTESPVSSELTPRIERSGKHVTLSWRRPEGGGAKLSFLVLRTTGGDGCVVPTSGAGQCYLQAPIIQATSNPSYTDAPGRGRFFYRIAAVADNRANPETQDLLLVGPAISVRV